jgi:hypothetical protein
MDYLMTLKEYLRLSLRLRNGTKHIRCQVCKMLSGTISGMGQLRKSPRKSSRADLFLKDDCVTNVKWQQLRITFSFRKRMAWNVLFYAWLLTYEPGLNSICATGPGPGAGPCRPLHHCRLDRELWGTHTVTTRKTLCSCWGSNPRRPIPGQTRYQLSYPGSQLYLRHRKHNIVSVELIIYTNYQ